MSTPQILAIIALIGVAAWSYLPNISLPVRKRTLMDDIEDIVRIRTTYPAAADACNALLKVLLEVGK